jgi:hypothetical protein
MGSSRERQYVASKFWTSLGLMAVAPLLHAQSVPTATRNGDLQVGAGFAIASSDYAPEKFKGMAAYVDYDILYHFGIEGEFRFVTGPTDLYEKTYEIGGRYHRNYGRFSPYAKIMIGRGVFNFQNGVANLAYNMGAIGGGVDYKIKPYITIRGDYEYQRWSGFPPNGLTPSTITIGAAYHFH